MISEFELRTHLSYPQYLATAYTVDSLTYKMDLNMRESLVAQEEMKGALSLVEGAISSSEQTIALKLGAIDETLAFINANIVAGFDAVISTLGSISTNIEELVRVAKTPAETWALNQFDIARTSFQRGLLPEALQSVERAINGHGDNTGYRIDHRFHQLLGIIRLGIAGNPDSARIVDLKASERAYMDATRYAEAVNDKTSSLVGAGKAAYCDNRLDDAEAHFKTALALHKYCGEAHYQLARISAYRNDGAVATHLQGAFIENLGYPLRSMKDPAFSGRLEDIRRAISGATRQLYDFTTASAKRSYDKFDFIRSHPAIASFDGELLERCQARIVVEMREEVESVARKFARTPPRATLAGAFRDERTALVLKRKLAGELSGLLEAIKDESLNGLVWSLATRRIVRKEMTNQTQARNMRIACVVGGIVLAILLFSVSWLLAIIVLGAGIGMAAVGADLIYPGDLPKAEEAAIREDTQQRIREWGRAIEQRVASEA